MGARLYLASKSPRRLEILSALGLDVCVIASHAHTRGYFPGDETVRPGELPGDYVVRTAWTKFREGLEVLRSMPSGTPPGPVLAADTVVSCGGRILGKPRDAAEAMAFLRLLSGRAHEVRTTVVAGAALERARHLTNTTTVWFRELNEDEMARYVATGEPYDKAGGYGIQGLAGVFISRIDGSFTGVMGLPVMETAELLKMSGIRLP